MDCGTQRSSLVINAVKQLAWPAQAAAPMLQSLASERHVGLGPPLPAKPTGMGHGTDGGRIPALTPSSPSLTPGDGSRHTGHI